MNGKAIKAVAQPTKQGFLYVFDRVTGKPVWPIEEQPVEKGNVPGEWYSPTQPFPTKPPAYSRNGVTVDDLIDFTPALHDQALTIVAKYKLGPVYTPPVREQVDGPLATLTLGTASGGTNWPGGSYDPETHTVVRLRLQCLRDADRPGRSRRKEISDMRYVAGTAGQEVRMRAGPARTPAPIRRCRTRVAAAALARRGGGGGGGGGLNVQGLPLIKPPYATISRHQSRSRRDRLAGPARRNPDAIRNHPALKGLDIPRTGQSGYNIGTLDHQDAGDRRRRPGHHHRRRIRAAPCCAPTTRPPARKWARSDARAAERLAHDLHAERQAVHRGRGQRRRLQR